MLVVSPSEDAQINIKITDFGTGKVSVKSQSSDYDTLDRSKVEPKNVPKKPQNPDSGPGIGTLIYCAPEVFGPPNYPIGKTDIFSFGVSMYQIFTGTEPYSEPPFKEMSRFKIRDFVRNGERLPIPPTINPAIASIIRKCWAHNPADRPEFSSVVAELEAVKTNIQKDEHTRLISSHNVPVPKGNLAWIGWGGEASRESSEEKLMDKPAGTFIVRYSQKTKSYVLSYVTKSNPPNNFQHIGYIRPQADGRVTVAREDNSQQHYNSIFEYVEAMRKTGIIKEPYIEEDSNYASSPAVYVQSPVTPQDNNNNKK